MILLSDERHVLSTHKFIAVNPEKLFELEKKYSSPIIKPIILEALGDIKGRSCYVSISDFLKGDLNEIQLFLEFIKNKPNNQDSERLPLIIDCFLKNYCEEFNGLVDVLRHITTIPVYNTISFTSLIALREHLRGKHPELFGFSLEQLSEYGENVAKANTQMLDIAKQIAKIRSA